jgi:hypothetical protein
MLIFATLLITAAFVTPAFAYLDPGTGSMILQAIIGGVAVASTALSVYWQRIRQFFASRKKNKQ